MSALMLLASGCVEPLHELKAGDVDEIPLLVRFSAGCPVDVIQAVESCAPLPPDVPPGRDLVCRQKDKKIVWLAVTGDSLPYQADKTLPQFGIAFKDANYDPIEKPSGKDPCKDSLAGVLDCKMKKDAPHGTYKYSVVVGACSVLDPRIYVP